MQILKSLILHNVVAITRIFIADMIRGKELTCSEHVMTEIFEEEKMVLLYRFSLEIGKAKNSLNLNLGTPLETDDHIVPTIPNNQMQSEVQAVRSVPTPEFNSQVWGRQLMIHTTPPFGMYVIEYYNSIYLKHLTCPHHYVFLICTTCWFSFVGFCYS